MKAKAARLKMFCGTERHKRAESGVKGHIPYHLFCGMGLAVVLLFAGIGIVGATADYYVATWGCDSNKGTSVDFPWQHPSYAAQKAQAGDTIYLIDGTWYDEHIEFANSGNATYPITMTAYNGTPTLDGVTGAGMAFYTVDKSYIKITNLKIINYVDGFVPHGEGSDMEVSNCYIDVSSHAIRFDGIRANMKVHNTTIKIPYEGSQCTISTVTHNYNTTYSDNIISESGWNGPTLNYAHDSIACNNVISNTYHNGMQMSGNSSNCVFKNNTVHDTNDNGYYITWNEVDPTEQIRDSIIEDCTAYDIRTRAILLEGKNITVRRFKTWNISPDLGGSDIQFNIGKSEYVIDSELDCMDHGGPGDIYLTSSNDTKLINTKFIGIFIEDSDITVYYYLDVLVQDENGNPVEGANVTVTHPNVNVNYYDIPLNVTPINLHVIPREFTDGLLDPQPIIETYTGSNGHTPLPSDSDNTFVIADYRVDEHATPRHRVTTYFDNWILTAEKNGITATVTGIDPDKNWYREDPNSYPIEDKGAVIITLPTTVETPTTYTTITPQPDETGWNNVTPVVIAFFRSDSDADISHTNYSKTSETGPWTTVDTATATGPDAENVAAISESGFNVTVPEEGTTQIWYYSVDSDSNVELVKDITVKIATPAAPGSDLIGEWRFEEGTEGLAVDSSGNGNNGTIHSASGATGKIGTALDFDGLDDYVSIPNSPTLNPAAEITLSAWINPGIIPQDGYRKIIAKPYTNYTSPWQQYALTLHDNHFVFELNTDGTKNVILSTETVEPNIWYHVTGTYDGSEMRIYVNAALNGTLPKSGAIAAYPTDVHIGAGIYSDRETEYFNGTLDEVKIYNRALSVEEVREDYEAGLNGAANTLSGAVTGPDSVTGIAGATVTLTTLEGTEINTTQTDSTGNYAFADVSAGFYNLTATKLGYWPDSDPVTVTAEAPITADIVLCQKGDLNTNSEPADAGDLAMMADATAAGTSDETYDLDGDGNPADAADLRLLKEVSVGVAELE